MNTGNLFSDIRRFLRSRTVQAVISLLIGGIALYLALRNVDLTQVGEVLRRARGLFVFLAVGSVAVNALSKAARWQVLLYEKGVAIPYLRLLMILLVGQTLNNLFPARLGDIGRAYVTGGREEGKPGRTYVLGTVVVEKIVDLFFYLLIIIVVLLLVPEKAWMAPSLITLIIGASLVILMFVVLVAFPVLTARLVEWGLGRLPERISNYLAPRVQAGIRSLEVVKSRGDFLKIMAWSLIVWGTAILNNYLVLLALRIHLPLTAPLLILVGLQAGISLPSVPGWIGVFEYICVITLAYFGVEQNTAFGYGVLLHAVVLGPAVLAGVISLGRLGGMGAFVSLPDSEASS